MGLARYFIVRHQDAWLVTLEGQVMARHRRRRAAVDAAIIMADLMGAMHHDADVMAEDASAGRLDTVWEFGRDPLPRAVPEGSAS